MNHPRGYLRLYATLLDDKGQPVVRVPKLGEYYLDGKHVAQRCIFGRIEDAFPILRRVPWAELLEMIRQYGVKCFEDAVRNRHSPSSETVEMIDKLVALLQDEETP
jgi:hypothetical protein